MVGVNRVQRIGFLGGTFDPPHIGHLILAEYTVEALALDRLFFVPAADPPHKRGRHKAAIQHRIAMLELALAGNEHFTLSRLDVDRDGPHYSSDSVRMLQRKYPEAELYFVMGGDSFQDFPNWHEPEIIAEYCKLAVMYRPGSDALYPAMHEAVLPGLAERVVMVEAPGMGIDIASSEIVQRVQEGKSIRYLVTEAVLHYLQENGLYKG